MTIDEAIAHAKEVVENNRKTAEECLIFDKFQKADECVMCAEEHEQLAEWLEELKELRAYKEKMEMQWLDDINNPLEPLKLQSALQSEIFKYNYRKEYKPQDLNILDYTVMYALKHCLEEQLKAGGDNDNIRK